MIIVDEMKNLKLYRKPMFLPTLDSDKKKKSAIFLLSPNYTSSKNLMMNPLLINKKRFSSYYIERDLTYFINSRVMQKYEGTSEGYVRNMTGYEYYDALLEMTTEERREIPDKKFGIPSKRKYPLHDKDHVLQAIRFFNYVDKEDEKELAKNLNKAIGYYFDAGEKPSISEKNRFSKYYKEDTCVGVHVEKILHLEYPIIS